MLIVWITGKKKNIPLFYSWVFLVCSGIIGSTFVFPFSVLNVEEQLEETGSAGTSCCPRCRFEYKVSLGIL